MNGLNALYKALGNRRQEDERKRLETERILALEKQRKQQAAANRHSGMMSTINLVGTVGGAIVGGVGGGGPAGAMAGASLGSALASGITGLAPNVAGTQPGADNPYYNAPSDSQRAMSAINSGLQVYSAYETNMAQKENQKALNQFNSWRQGHLMNPTGDGYQAVQKGMSINEDTGLANYWTDPSGGGYNLDDLPFGLSKDDLLNIGTQQRDTWIQQVAPVAEMAKYRGADLTYQLEKIVGPTDANKMINNVIERKAKGDTKGIEKIIAQVDSKEGQAYLREISKLPPVALFTARATAQSVQGLTSKQKATAKTDNKELATESFNKIVDELVGTGKELVAKVQSGGSTIEGFTKLDDNAKKMLGQMEVTELPPAVTDEMFIHLSTMNRVPGSTQFAAALNRHFDGETDRINSALLNLSKFEGVDPQRKQLYLQTAQGLSVKNKTLSNYIWIEDDHETSSAGTQETSGSAGTQGTSGSAGYTPTGRYDTNPPTGAKPGGDANTPPSTPPGIEKPVLDVPNLSDASTDPRLKDPNTEYRSQNDDATLVIPDALVTPKTQTPVVNADFISDRSTNTDFTGKSETFTGTVPQVGTKTPSPRTTGPTGLRNMYPVPGDDPIVAMAPRFEEGLAPMRTEGDVYERLANQAIKANNAVPGGPTQTPTTDKFVAVREVGGPLENGRKRFIDQFGRVAVEKPEVFEVAGYGHVVAPTLDDNGNEKPADQVAFELIDSIEASGRPLDLETGQTLPMFDSREKAEAWRDNRKEAIGETVPATVKSGSTTARTSMNTEFTEAERPQLGGRERSERSSATSTNIRAALENAEPLGARAERLIPEWVGTPAAPTNRTLRNLIENSRGEYQPINTPTTAERIDADIANAPIERAAGPDMQRLEAEQENIDRQQGEKIESSFDKYLSMQRAKREERKLRQGNAGRGRPPTENEISNRSTRLQQAADIRNAAAAQVRDNKKEMSLKTMYDSEFIKGQSPSGDTSDAGRLSRLDPRQDRTAGVDPDYNSWFNEYYRERALKEALDATPERPELPEQPKRTGVQAELNQAFEEAGIDNLTPIMESIVNLESDGRHIKNKSGSEAFGLLQITPAVVEKYLGKNADLKDNDTYMQTAVMLFKDNEAILKRNEYPVNFTNMYVLHHFGVGGFNLLAANPETQLKDVTYRKYGSATQENPRGIQLPLINKDIKQQNQWLGRAAESLGVTVDRMTVGDMLKVLEQAGITGDFPKKRAA
jgi:hypothetical protein